MVLEQSKHSVLSKRSFRRQSILLIDDDDDQRALFEALLAIEQYDVFCAASAQEAFEVMMYRPMDLIVCDLRMPDMSGLDFVQSVRNSPLLPISPEIPIIIITAGGADLELISLDTGADMFCQKRAAKSLLISQIKFLLD